MNGNDDSLIIEIGARLDGFAKSLSDANSTASRAFASIEARGDAASKKLDASFAKVGASPSLTLLSKSLLGAEANAGKLVSRLQQAKATLDSTKAGAFDKFAAGQTTSALALLQQVQAAGSLKNFAALSGGALGVGALAAGVVAAQTKQLGDLKEAADEARVTAAQLAGLQSIFGKLGFSADDAGKLIKTFSDRLLDAKAHGGALSDALDAAGIAFTDESGALRPTIEVLSDLTRYMRTSTDEAGKLKIATAAVGDELGSKFADAVSKGGSALDNLQVATNRVGSAITNDLAEMAQSGIRSLDSLWDHVNRLYSRMKELAGLQLTSQDQANVVAQHLQEAIGARAGLDTAAVLREVSSKEIAEANQKLFEAAAAFDKANPIKVLPGGDPREKAASKPAPVPLAPANDDASAPSSRRSAGRASSDEDKAPAVIADLQRQLQLAQATGDAHQRIADQIKIANELKRAGVAADSAEGRQIADLVRATDAATVAAKAHNEVLKARKETVDLIGTSLESSVEGVLLNGAKLNTIFSGLAQTLARAALQGALLGQGPLAGLLGGSTAATTTSAGGLLGSLVHLAGFAEGGQISGPGTGTSDSILARLSRGEFIVNAKATKASLPILHAINEGKMPRFASGGQVGATTAPVISTAGAVGAPIAVTNHVELHTNGGTQAQNADLAKQVGAQIDGMVRGTIADELRKQMRGGNLLDRR